MRNAVFQRRRLPKLPPPVRIDDPLIARAMSVPEIIVPAEGDFRGMYSDDDLADLGRRDRKTVRAISILEQWSVWNTERVAEDRGYLRQIEAENIGLKMKIKHLEEVILEHGWKLSFGRWILVTVGAGLVATLLKVGLEHIIGK